jgi:hypothetical protein
MFHGELVQALDSAHITRIRNTQYTHEIFDVFDKENASTGVQRRVALLFKLINLKMAEGESLRDHIVTFDKLMSDLSSTGDPVSMS